ncbi:MAG: alpha-1,2-fucosyltransferase [Verrucomicrobia bacterium]|nr:MAG: alpha-1,2-fucosyltransferase [Verrucomicrobiota bacterium]TAE86060.1 MAG: alpha-1,2-fucosyltransferase [Verrucomicrobiota bacterium]TAF25849.1 MAG: alpha-1,2-fucosyltransferase [Verrucomicrobiota bacterium]
MIRAVMLGRLGNNLFQYALGRVLAEKHGVPLVMDASWFNAAGWSEVKCLRELPGPAAGLARVVRRASIAARAFRNLGGGHYWQYRGVPMLREETPAFDARFLDAPADCVLFGYFQTPRYFESIEPLLRVELATGGLGLERGREELAESLRDERAVAVHVRRGDYVGNPLLDLCGVDYYEASMARLRADIPGARFFIFSDDPEWCELRLRGEDVRVVPKGVPGQSPLVDLHLMSLARQQIIANSSYSWWAAWLGKKPGQRVIMPSKWFHGVHAPIEEKRCEGWEGEKLR